MLSSLVHSLYIQLLIFDMILNDTLFIIICFDETYFVKQLF